MGPTHPTPSRQRRSSSTASNRSGFGVLGINTPSTSASSVLGSAQQPNAAPAPLGGISQASADRAAAAGGSLSRNPSVRSTSGTSTPARPSFDYSAAQPSVYSQNLHLPHRPSLSNTPSWTSQAVSTTAASTGATAGSNNSIANSLSSFVNSTQHYTDAAHARAELEIVKAENEGLRQRVRSLEQALKSKRRESQQSQYSEQDRSLSRQSPQAQHGHNQHTTGTGSQGGLNVSQWAAGASVAGPRERSESQSTTASSRRPLHAEDRDDTIRVGESAANTITR